ncbi:hypothetical protein DFP72DRAFT_1108608 [Ephemerocybe angulata]|uniref:Uncharacterized protein n=1 Tax=Ephemerocybe angulata TaxID=980116 RepID=A0A8H6IKK8_9AGAR|nr:hypothetical protein DFP72DRAFT_1108608 [Tulosesus angulatus]
MWFSTANMGKGDGKAPGKDDDEPIWRRSLFCQDDCPVFIRGESRLAAATPASILELATHSCHPTFGSLGSCSTPDNPWSAGVGLFNRGLKTQGLSTAPSATSRAQLVLRAETCAYMATGYGLKGPMRLGRQPSEQYLISIWGWAMSNAARLCAFGKQANWNVKIIECYESGRAAYDTTYAPDTLYVCTTSYLQYAFLTP